MSTASTEGPLKDETETKEQEGLERLRQLVIALVDRMPGLRDEIVDEGLAPLVHQFERRLGRCLSADEHGALRERLHALGPARLGDVVLDLTPTALAAWLADPAAT